MRCEELMKTEVETTSADDPVQLAATKMRDANVGFLPVCEASGKVIGTLTDRDIAVRLVADGGLASTPVGSIMTRDVVGCRPWDDLGRAEQLMSQHRKSRLLVLDDDGSLRGVISLSDLAQADEDAAGPTLRDVASRETHLH